jgi:hypothetical protein
MAVSSCWPFSTTIDKPELIGPLRRNVLAQHQQLERDFAPHHVREMARHRGQPSIREQPKTGLQASLRSRRELSAALDGDTAMKGETGARSSLSTSASVRQAVATARNDMSRRSSHRSRNSSTAALRWRRFGPTMSIASASCCVSAKMRPREKRRKRPEFRQNARENVHTDRRRPRTTDGKVGRNQAPPLAEKIPYGWLAGGAVAVGTLLWVNFPANREIYREFGKSTGISRSEMPGNAAF